MYKKRQRWLLLSRVVCRLGYIYFSQLDLLKTTDVSVDYKLLGFLLALLRNRMRI